ncbi:hypothetical protein BCR33DRAFT_823344 [Rhizoclosmatium globosum]|uniref:Uncharacterized protein n=1 Tax=Rhizoclosmatium globosum TaxID=329046 RepID=A0A1Y2C5N2_9FUNG|nr:hypothetical protein BCR33DRAFT_823344 [Rhizoclosmatium globosum]|eukprot:ORY42348.1 hypothetical protein BCR33DRAFT_823344 [Rhizoclosmatium globosum]
MHGVLALRRIPLDRTFKTYFFQTDCDSMRPTSLLLALALSATASVADTSATNPIYSLAGFSLTSPSSKNSLGNEVSFDETHCQAVTDNVLLPKMVLIVFATRQDRVIAVSSIPNYNHSSFGGIMSSYYVRLACLVYVEQVVVFEVVIIEEIVEITPVVVITPIEVVVTEYWVTDIETGVTTIEVTETVVEYVEEPQDDDDDNDDGEDVDNELELDVEQQLSTMVDGYQYAGDDAHI